MDTARLFFNSLVQKNNVMYDRLKIKSVHSMEDVGALCDLVFHSRSKPDQDKWLKVIKELMLHQNLMLVGAFRDNLAVAFIGFRQILKLDLSKIIYIDDIWINHSLESTEAVNLLLKYVKSVAIADNTNLVETKVNFSSFEQLNWYNCNGFEPLALNLIFLTKI